VKPIPDGFEGVIYVTGGVVRLWRDRGPNPDCADMTPVERKVAGARLWGVLEALGSATRTSLTTDPRSVARFDVTRDGGPFGGADRPQAGGWSSWGSDRQGQPPSVRNEEGPRGG